MSLPIVTLGNELLSRTSRMVADVADLDESTQRLIDGMYETLGPARGIGLAAVQVGKLVRIFVTAIPGDTRRVFINPDIVETSLEQHSFEEGCLSLPGINADVVRPSAVRIQAWDRRGKPFVIDAEGILGRVVQHELDHLNGVVFTERIPLKKAKRLLKGYDPNRFREGIRV